MRKTIVAGLITLPLVLTFSFASGAVLFNGPLAPYFSIGARAALLSVIVANILCLCFSQFYFQICSPDPTPHAILAAVISAVAAECVHSGLAAAILPSTLIIIFCGTALTAILCFTVGQLKLGNIIRYTPYPVLAGFITACGVLLFKDAGTIMTGIHFHYAQALDINYLKQFWPGIAYGLLLCGARLTYDRFITTPIILMIALTIVLSLELFSWLSGHVIFPNHFFFQTHTQSLYEVITKPEFRSNIAWSLILKQIGYIVSFAVLVLFTLLLSSSNLEAETEIELDLDRQSRFTGYINASCALTSGICSVLNLGASTLSVEMESKSRISTLVVVIAASLLLFIGPEVVSFIPKFLISGVLIYVAFITIRRWLFQAWSELSSMDYIIILIILVVSDIWGLLQGIGVGLAISCIQFIINYSQILPIKFSMPGSRYHSNVLYASSQRKLLQDYGKQLHIIKLQGYLFFGSSHNLLDYIQKIYKQFGEQLRYLLLDFKLVDALDTSASFSLLKIKQFCKDQNLMLIFTHLDEHEVNKLKQAKVLFEHDSIIQLFPDIDYGISWCERQLLGTKAKLDDKERLHEELKARFKDAKQCAQFMKYCEPQELEKGSYLFHEGDEAKDLFLIGKGRLAILHKTDENSYQRLRAMGAGSIVGEIGFYMNVRRTASIYAELDSLVYRLSFAKFREINNNHPDLALALHTWIVQLFAERLVHASHELEVLYAPPVVTND